MTREAIKRLLISVGLALLLIVSPVLPLRAASPAHPANHQRAKSPAQTTITETTPMTPSTVVSPTGIITLPLDASLVPTVTTTPSPTPTLTVISIPTTTLRPAPTQTASPAPPLIETNTPTLAPTQTPIPAPTPTVAPTPTRSPINRVITFLSANRTLAGLICLIPLCILALLLIILAMRRKTPAPIPSPPPTPAIPPTLSAGPYLESIRTAGGPRRFGLRPEGVIIGRDQETDLTITQDFPRWETVSKYHARIYQLAGRWIVEDIDSMNGVYVNGRRTGRNLLQDGWQLDIGGVGFVFRARTEEAEQ
jgi:hypothetical protein